MKPTYHAFTGIYTKAQAVALAQEHFDKDNFTKGTYGDGDYTNTSYFKGCSVGCMAGGNHQDFAPLYGIPPQVAYLGDSIFEALPDPEHKIFTLQVFQAIPEYADLDRVYDKFAAWLIGQSSKAELQAAKDRTVMLTRAAAGDEPSTEEWEDVARDLRADGADGAARAQKSRDKLIEILANSPVVEVL